MYSDAIGEHGATYANTAGGELVIIEGRNFGPLGTVVESATYGPNGTEFQAAACYVSIAHTEITCMTTVGAGTALKWFLFIDGQKSVAPTTSYGRPEIASMVGDNGAACTDGGDIVTIAGGYFSTQPFLDSVTFGPSGMEFTPTGKCQVVADHTTIACTLPPGIGKRHAWRITVGGQTNLFDPAFSTSYASPFIASVAPPQGTTKGGNAVVVAGSNYALRYTAAALEVKFNSHGSPAPDSWASFKSNYMDMGVDVPAGAPEQAAKAWLASLPSALITFRNSFTGCGNHSLQVQAPEGFGQDREVIVVVNGYPSNIVYYDYAAPIVTNVATDRTNLTGGMWRVFVEGSSFCSASCFAAGKATLSINGIVTPVLSWTHDRIIFIEQAPPASAQGRTFVVTVDGIASNGYLFLRPPPAVDQFADQGTWTGMDTRGDEFFYINGVVGLLPIPVGVSDVVKVFIGEGLCTSLLRRITNLLAPSDPMAEWRIECRTPPGMGVNLGISISTLDGASSSSLLPLFSYAAPNITRVTGLVNNEEISYLDPYMFADGTATPVSSWPLPDSPAYVYGIPTLGGLVQVYGINLGDMSFGVTVAVTIDNSRSLPITVVSQTHTRMVLSFPPSDGSHSFRIDFDAFAQNSNTLQVRYAPPTVSSVSPVLGPTLGGQLLTITGYNFGVNPVVTLDGQNPCIITSYVPAVALNGTSVIVCTTPPGQGANLPVTVTASGQSSSPSTPARYSYYKPQVFSIWPTTAPSSGLDRVTGNPIIITLLGMNLGINGSLEFRPSPVRPTDPLSENFFVPWYKVIFHNDSMIRFPAPEGFGYNMTVVVVVTGQESNEQVIFDFDAPSVVSISRPDVAASQCNPIAIPLSGYAVIAPPGYENNTMYKTGTRMMYPPCFATAGGYLIRVAGDSFAKKVNRVWIGSKECIPLLPEVMARFPTTHTDTYWLAPRGIGSDLPVFVQVGSRISPYNPNATFSYDPPKITSIDSNRPDAEGGAMSLYGENFGDDPTPLTVNISGIPCPRAIRYSNILITCDPGRVPVGRQNISLQVANSSIVYSIFDFEQGWANFECKAGFYGLDTEYCMPCPPGAVCPGGEHQDDLTYAKPGWFRDNITNSLGSPHPTCVRVNRTSRLACPNFLPCEPKWNSPENPGACTGWNMCGLGYAGFRCQKCDKGFHRVVGLCEKCPSSPWLVIIMFIAGSIAALAVAYALNKYKISLVLISIGIDWAQVLSMFLRTRIRWPVELIKMFNILSAFNVNLDLAAPECALEQFTYEIKWAFIECMPLIAIAILMFYGVLKFAYKRLFTAKKRHQLWSHMPQIVSVSIVIFRVLYLYLTRMSLDVFNCAPTSPPDPPAPAQPNTYLSGDTSIICGAAGSIQTRLIGPAIVAFVGYSLVLPIIAFTFLWKSRYAVKYDQLLRAQGLGDDRLSNPRFYGFRKRYQKLYGSFKPSNYLGELAIIWRKFSIAIASLFFRTTPSYQLAVVLLILFIAFSIHTGRQPYLDHASKHAVLDDHMLKAQTEQGMHRAISEEMRQVKRKNMKATTMHRFDSRRLVANKLDATVLSMFSYNTVESVMLGSAILINLAGIMFDSSRFAGDQFAIYQREYNGLAYGTLAIIILTIVYYFLSFIIDIIVVSRPATAEKLVRFISGNTRRAMLLGFLVLGPLGLILCAGRKRNRQDDSRKAMKSMITGPEMSFNTAMFSGASANEMASAAAALNADGDTLSSDIAGAHAKDIASMDEPPPKHAWDHLRGMFIHLMTTCDKLQIELRSTKIELENLKQTSNGDRTFDMGKKRRQQYVAVAPRSNIRNGSVAATGDENGSLEMARIEGTARTSVHIEQANPLLAMGAPIGDIGVNDAAPVAITRNESHQSVFIGAGAQSSRVMNKPNNRTALPAGAGSSRRMNVEAAKGAASPRMAFNPMTLPGANADAEAPTE
jgi:hypothetical protein